ncbi:MAG: succinate dehydrogenase/fumarate reductase cytochrome b subunit [Paludibacteraceae bacterium]|nr:succinate dehydrogenase/fumarate reductase cytochrome b subunit [Paludibacteraceae bacterium]
MWLKDSSIGRKLVMSITGLALVFFLLFHGCMNVALVFSEEAYNWICSILGANWYAIVGTLGLAFLVLVHFCYAFYLTILNLRARGNDRYAVTARQEGVDWESKNMLVLGICVIGFLVLHLANFWFKMQFAELTGIETSAFKPHDGAGLVKFMFAGNGVWSIVLCVLYLIWLGALWLHLNHGIWSALHTLGWSNLIWLKRIKVIGTILASLVVAPFAVVVFYYLGMGIGLML